MCYEGMMGVDILAIDPGREKSGMAVLSEHGVLRCKKIVPTETIEDETATLLAAYPSIERIVCGNGTNHNAVSDRLKAAAKGTKCDVVLTEEAHTTEEARKRYFEYNPPKGLKRLIPKGMLYPPEPVDDFTAWIIGERYLSKL